MRDLLVAAFLAIHCLATSDETCGGREGAGATFTCTRGFGQPPNFCSATSLTVQISQAGVCLHLPTKPELIVLPELKGGSVARLWNVSFTPAIMGEGYVADRAECSQATAFFITVPYAESIGGRVNYYQWHVDVLLPLYVAFEHHKLLDEASTSALVNAVIYPAVSDLQWPTPPSAAPAIAWTTPAFDDPSSFWMQTLETMTDGAVRPLAAQAVNLEGPTSTTMRYSRAFLGLPSVEHPSAPVMLNFVNFLRGRLGLSADPVPCSAPDVIAFVRRTNRRVLLNEADLAAAVQDDLGAVVQWIEFGREGFKADVAALQHVRVLVGGQGSGLTNGLYLRPHSAVVCLYQLGAWDVFEEYLKPRGPYRWWANSNPAASVCNKTVDRFCDSPDTVVDISAALEVIKSALADARARCAPGILEGWKP